MKTPKEWTELWSQSGAFDLVDSMQEARNIVEDIQKDALSDPMAQTTDQQELEMAKDIAMNERIRANQLHDELMKTRAKWHEARRYLRAANKGAARNAMVAELATERNIRLYSQLEEHRKALLSKQP